MTYHEGSRNITRAEMKVDRKLIYLLLLLSCSSFHAEAAKKRRLSPEKKQQLIKEAESFKKCKARAFNERKTGKIDTDQFKSKLLVCREKFPSASIYVSCKKKAKKVAKKKKISLKKALSQCQRYRLAATFSPKNPLPILVNNDRVYFAGLGLNNFVPTNNFNPPNFDCSKLDSVAEGRASADYLLFGNHMKYFQGFRSEDTLEKTQAKHSVPNGEEKIVDEIGMLYNPPTSENNLVFFPTASCPFQVNPGRFYEGMTSYYLVDQSSKLAYPYFGVAFYSKNANKVKTRNLASRLESELGKGFKSYSKGNELIIVSKKEIKEFDSEGDPSNVCKPPRQNDIIGIIKGKNEDPQVPEYILIANIRNLCEFGDRVSQRFKKTL